MLLTILGDSKGYFPKAKLCKVEGKTIGWQNKGSLKYSFLFKNEVFGFY